MKSLFQRNQMVLAALMVLAILFVSACGRKPANNTLSPEITGYEESTEEISTEDLTDEEPTTKEQVTEAETTEEETTEEVTTEEPTTEEPTFAPVDIKEVTETVWATTSVNVREFWDKDAKKVGGLKKGQLVTRTGICDNGWNRIQYKGKEAYVNGSYLTDVEPETEPPTTAPPETAAPVVSGPAAGKTWVSIGDSITAQQGWQGVVTSSLGFSKETVVGKPGAVFTPGQEQSFLGDYAMAIPSDANYVLLKAGINDLIFNMPIGEASEEGTFKCGVNRTIDRIRDYAPNAKIIVVTPINTYGLNNQNGQGLGDYVAAIKEIAQNQGCPVIDMYSDGTFTPDNQGTYTKDGIHLNDTGKQKLGEVLAGYLKNIL